jgi:hypothetical protein
MTVHWGAAAPSSAGMNFALGLPRSLAAVVIARFALLEAPFLRAPASLHTRAGSRRGKDRA